MNIDVEKVQEAKEKLGDKNAEIMAELLELEDYDEKNMKAHSPYRQEDTASFIYDKKSHRFHDFGGEGVTVDIIDVLMQKGLTYLQACRKLFEYAEIDYAFGEEGVRTKRNYKYPHDENGDITCVYEYLGKRGISRDTVDYLNIGTDGKGNCVFRFYDTNDVLTLVKYRPAHTVEKKSGKPKTWCQKDSDTTPLLFNMNRINTSQPLLVTEGECLTGDTEVMTKHGWVRLDSYNGQEVMQVHEDMSGSFCTPLQYVKKDYDGDLYTIKKGGNYELTTTAGHNLVYVDYKKRVTKRKAMDFPKSLGNGYLPTSIKYDSIGINLSDYEIALWLAISADGTIDVRDNPEYNYCRIAFKKERKIERFEGLLLMSDYSYTKTIQPSNPDKTFFGVKIPKYITKIFPFELIAEMSLKQRLFVLQEMTLWDGNYVSGRNQVEYSSKLYENAVFMQTVAHTCGYMSTIMKRKNDFGEWYKVSILFGKNGVSFQKGFDSIDKYVGKVYCVTVPTGMIFVRKNGHIAITGNCDAASAIEAGYYNTVSVPLGANNFSWIEENFDFLEQFESIIIASDNDSAGEKMRNECVYRLGSWRTKYIEYPKYKELEDGRKIPISDMNDTLQAFGAGYVMNMIINAKDTPVDSVVDFADVEDIDISTIDGIETGIQQFDQEMMRLFYGSFNIVTGTNGSGKSSFLGQLTCNSIEQGKDVWMYSKELPNYMTKNWIDSIFAGVRNVDEHVNNTGSKYYTVQKDSKKKIDEYYRGHFKLYKDEWGNTIEDIKKSMEDCVRKFGNKLFIIDNLTAINFDCSDNEKWSKQVDLVNYCIQFAQKFHVVVVLVIHPKKIETYRRLTKFDVQGLGSIVDLCHRLISLYRVQKKEKTDLKNPIKYDVLCDILKDRLRGKEGLEVGMYYSNASRRFYTSPEEYDRQYSWDRSVYDYPVKYPHENENPFG